MELITSHELLNKDLKGKIVVFPTDTVYGVGALIDDIEAIDKIYKIKERDYSKPLAVLTATINISKYVTKITSQAKQLMTDYWPGALTIIFDKSDYVLDKVTSNLKTIGIRMPNNEVALRILRKFGLMATTSINKSGEKPLNTLNEIVNQFKDQIDYIVIDESITSQVSSTVVDAREDKIKVLREGEIKIN